MNPVVKSRSLFEEEHQIYRDAIRRFLAEAAVPNLDAWSEEGRPPPHFIHQCGERGMLCPQVPEAYGGQAARSRQSDSRL